MSRRNIVICGNGASAALLLCALARRGEGSKFEVTVIGTGPRLGAGIAYATQNPNHLLNVPAARMSADPLEPQDFENFLAGRGIKPADFAQRFVARGLYADYLDQTLKSLLPRDMQKHVRQIRAQVHGLIRVGLSWTVLHGEGSTHADLVVLASGLGGPAPIAGRYAKGAAARIIEIPWGEPQVDAKDDVLVLGTGLTAMDTVISLRDRGHTGRITLLSRHGMLPATHVPPVKRDALTVFPKSPGALLRALKKEAGKTPEEWQGLMDAMRPHWPEIWDGFDEREKGRALRHGLSHWNRHRHRVAPAGAARVRDAGVAIIAGRLSALTMTADQRLTATVTHKGKAQSLAVDRVINCTGPALHKGHDALMENLIASRQARIGPAGLGLDVDDRNRVTDGDGLAQPSLFALGALTRGRWWEITAIPEISRQAMDIVGHIRAQFSLMDAANRLERKDAKA